MAWKVDPQQSEIVFFIKHFRVTRMRGQFSSFDGTIELNEENPGASSVWGTVDVASLRTGISLRDKNLRSQGRFDAKRFPTMRFQSTAVGDFEGDTFRVYGDLTIKDITRPVVLDVVNKGELPTDNGRRLWAFSASVVLDRRDWHIEWIPLVELGSIAVGTEVKGAIEILVVEKEAKLESPVLSREYAATA